MVLMERGDLSDGVVWNGVVWTYDGGSGLVRKGWCGCIDDLYD